MAGYKREVRPGVWRLEYMLDNEKYSKTIKVSSPSQANKELSKFIVAIEEGNFAKNSNIKFINFAQTWLDEYARPNLKQNTVDIYKAMLNSKVLPFLGTTSINKINKQKLTMFYNTLKEEYNSSTKTIKNYNGLISSIMQLAVDWDYIKFNPCSNIKLPKNEKNVDTKKFFANFIFTIYKLLCFSGLFFCFRCFFFAETCFPVFFLQ